MNATGGLEPLPLRPASFFTDNYVDFIRGTAAIAIDRNRQIVHLADGRQLEYSFLVIATGARVRPLGVAGADLPGVHRLRTLEDATRLSSVLRPDTKVVVIGAGFIGLECAAGLRSRRCAVTVLESGRRPMKRTSSPVMSEWFADAHRSAGIDLKMEERIARIEPADEGQRLVAISIRGNRYEGDAIICGNGVLANDTLAMDAGLKVDDGIIVDSSLRTSDPRILAVGDCARFPNAHTGSLTRLESVQNATAQGRHAALTILGKVDSFAAVPWFWSVQGAHRLQIAGLVGEHDQQVTIGKPQGGKFSVLNFQQGLLTSVESVNQPAMHMAARRLFEQSVPITYNQASQPGFTLPSAAKVMHPTTA